MSNPTHYTRTVALTRRPGLTSRPDQQPVTSMPRGGRRALPGPVICGAAVGAIQAVSPLGFWWLEPKTVYALGLTLIAAVDLPRAFRTAYLWVNSRCGLPFQIFLTDLLRSPVLKPGVPTL